MALYQAMFFGDPTPAQALRLITRHRVSLTQPIPIYYRERIQRIPGVRGVMAWQWFGGVYKDRRDPNNFFPRFGAEPEFFFQVYPEFKITDEEKQAFLHERTGAVVSRTLANKMNFKLGDRVTLVGDIFPITLELKIVGIFDEPDKAEIMYFNRAYLRDALGPNSPQQNTIGAFVLQAESAADVPRIADIVDRQFDSSPFPTRTESEKAFQLSFASFVGNLKLFIMAIFGAVTFTVLLVSGNTISMSVRERIREVGILKTLGFTPGAILFIILGESAVISIVGGVLGCILAAGICGLMRSGPGGNFMQALRTLDISPGVAGLCIATALLIGLLSSSLPAWSASRTSILDSLRSTG
jgi:putative ABC transport system permease protein